MGQWPDRYVHDAQIVTYTSGPYAGRQIAFTCGGENGGGTNTGLEILDVTDKGNIFTTARYFYSTGDYSHQGWLTADRKYFYLNDEGDEGAFGYDTRTRIINVEDIENPFEVGFFSAGVPAIDHNLYVRDNLIFEANYRSGLRVFDISDPEEPLQVGYFDTVPESDSANFNGLWSNYPFFESGIVIGSDTSKGLFVWRARQQLLDYAFPDGLPELIEPTGGIVRVEITERESDALVEGTAKLNWSADGETYQQVDLVNVKGNMWEGAIPGNECGTSLSYYFSAEVSDGVTETSPSGAPGSTYTALVASELIVAFQDDFESDQGWAVTGDANDGQWERAVPAGGGDRGDPPSDGDGSGRAYVTDNEDGNSDVDGGTTILTSPTLDGSDPLAQIGYWRWYSNDSGGDPNNDIFVVEISDDDGATWENLEVVGPAGEGTSGGWFRKDFLIADVPNISNSSTVRLRFSASDLSDGSVIEAGVDGVEITTLVCDESIPGDINGDGEVDFQDINLLLAAWGPCEGCPEDVDGSGTVDFGDVLILLANWT